MEKFQCLKCSGSELVYDKWIKCRDKVLIQYDTGFITYFDQEINDADVLPVECRFICSCCGQPPKLYGECIVTEANFQVYLEMTIDQRAEMQAEYDQKQEDEIAEVDLSVSDTMLL